MIRPLRALGIVVALIAGAVLVAGTAPFASPVSALPALAVSTDIAGDTLIGRDTPVEVSVTNTGDTTAFNLALTATVPLGVTVVNADRPATRTIALTDGAGTPTGTVVVWENIVDIRPEVLFRFRYGLTYDLGTGSNQWEVGDTADVTTDAYVNDVDAVRPTVTPSAGDPVSAVPAAFTQSGTTTGSTTLVPLLLTKDEPSIESELLRGVHDHQTVYTIRVESGAEGGVALGTLDDWLPAGLEFLGCGTEDNSSAEEYPGAGPLNPGNAPLPLASSCPAPIVVETVDTGLPAGLSGVHTHVQWDFTGITLPPNSVEQLSYVVGIPQRENTLTWASGSPPATNGPQGSNLDNNNGAPTTQVGNGTSYQNLAQIETTFGGVDTVVETTETVQAVDLSIHKFVSSPTIEQGAVSRWTLQIETSEYVVDGGVADLEVVDVTPDGTCPIGGGLSCTPLTTPPPSPAFTSAVFDGATGESTLTWDLSAETLGRSQRLLLGFSTVALVDYPGAGGPVSSNDSWSNSVSLTAEVDTFGPEGPGGPPTTNAVTDDSARGQSGVPVQFSKDVGIPAPGAACGDGTSITWEPDAVGGIGPGDRVCYRLTAIPPDTLDTIESSLVDFLPPGFEYEVGTNLPGPINQVPVGEVTFTVSGTSTAGQRLDWRLPAGTPLEPAQTAQVVFSAIVTNDPAGNAPDIGTSGDTNVNEARFSFENSNGEIFVVPDDGTSTFSEANLTLTKGIVQAGSRGPFSPPANDVTNVTGGEVVTYVIDVTNDGTRDAIEVTVLDLLPINGDGITAEDAVCSAISSITTTSTTGSGTCAGDDITWTAMTIPAGATIRLSYLWTLPATVSASTSWTNEAGVVEYRSATNVGTPFTYVPRNNIDPTREPEANTDPARDDARVSSKGLTLRKTRTTAIIESGNNGGNQATIGEVISFTVESREADLTEIENYVLTDDLSNRGLALVPGSVEVTGGEVPAAAANCNAATDDLSGAFVPTVTGDVIVVTGPAGAVTPPTGNDLCVRLTFDAVVEDAPTPAGERLNVRPNTVRNEAVLTFDIDPGVGVVGRTLKAGVNTAIVEPNLRIEKRSDNTGSVFPGAAVTYSLIVTNQSGTQVSTAHDLVIVDDYDQASFASVTVPPGSGFTIADDGDAITWTQVPGADPDGDGRPGLDPGASFTLTYDVVIADGLAADGTITNTATLTGTSINGAVAGERTASSACSPATCPGYVDEDSTTLTVGGPTIDKFVLQPNQTVGSEATYFVDVFLPPNLDYGNVTITDDLAGGDTRFIQTLGIACLGCTAAENTLIAGLPTDIPSWDLGALGSIPNSREVFIAYRTRVVNVSDTTPDPEAGDVQTNTATLTFNVDRTRTDTAAITIGEPDVSLVKKVSTVTSGSQRETTPTTPVTGVAGFNASYRLELTNNGDWTAYDVDVVDRPDTLNTTDCDTGTPRLSPVIIGNSPQAIRVDATLGVDDACLGWQIPAILPGQTVTIVYQLEIDADFPRADLVVGPELINTATVDDYFGLAASDRAGNPLVTDDTPGADGNSDLRAYGPLEASGHIDLAGGELGNLVWLDVDGDGNGPDTPAPDTDATEPGLAGIGVNWTPFVSASTTDTDANGRWTSGTSAPNWLLAATYTVSVDTGDLPPGLENSFTPPTVLTPSSAQSSLAENQVDGSRDFGYRGVNSIGDTVWLDANGNGTKEVGEPGIPNVELTVTWSGQDNVIGTADDVDYGTVTTDADGVYGVDFLPNGLVRVELDSTTLPTGLGLVPTFERDGVLDGINTIDLAADDLDFDFGFNGTAAVGDLVWLNLDGNAALDPGEPGIPGVTVTVTWEGLDGDLAAVADNVAYPAATTDALGGYLVGNLPPGDVLVAVDPATLPAGVTQTFDADSTLDDETVRTLAIGQTDRLADFGYTGDHTIGDLVWLDVDADGNGPDTPAPDTDASEPGVPGQPIAARWAGRDGTLDTVDDVTFATVDTDADGRWEITGVPDGLVRVTMTGGPSADFDITFDRDSTLDGVNEVTIDADDLDFDFGLAGRGSVGDLVWLDFVNDDIAGPSEPRIPGVSITATWAGFDGLLLTASDNVVYPSVLTDAAGLYTVGNLPAGDVRVVVDPATIPTGLFPSFDLDGGNDQQAVRTLAVAEDATDVDFGYLAEGELGDFVWWDLNGDGLQDASEPGLPGVTVTLTWDGFGSGATPRIAGGTVETTTDADGRYLFSGLPDGAYTVTVDVATLPPGLSITADPDGGDDSTSTLTLTSPDDNVNLDQDFGYVGALSIGDLVWSDVNRDGTRQPAEPAIAGAGITVTYLGSTSGTGDDVVVFDDATRPTRFALDTSVGPFIAAFLGGTPLPTEPSYLAGGLAPGTYRVTLDPATLPADFTPLSDRDGGDPAVTTLTLLAEDVDDADFAVFRNDAPAIVLPPTGNGVCGGTLTVDPLAGIDDPNGDTVSVVPGSIVAPAGVTVTLRPDGQLDIVTASSVTSDYTITWQVVDQRGAVTSVTLAVAITCFTVDIQSSCASNVPSISWAIVATGGTVTAPVSITWSDGGGNTQTDTGFGLVGTAPWPSAQWARKALDVTFTTADGAVVGPQLVAYLCELPATGSDVTQMLRAAFGLLLAGVAIMFATRRRNRFAR